MIDLTTSYLAPITTTVGLARIMKNTVDGQFGDRGISNELSLCDIRSVSRRTAELSQTTEDYALVV